MWPRSDAAIDLWLFTCKHHATFQQAPLDSILATVQEVFDFSIPNSNLKGSYSEDLLAFRHSLYHAYRRLSIGRPQIRIFIMYGSRGDTSQIGESIAARAGQIEASFRNLFSSSVVHFSFVGAAELVHLHRKSKRFALDLPFLEYLATGQDSYVLLVRLEDYWKFVSDDGGNLRRYLFDSNVRDFLGTNQVNEEIARSLADSTAPDFWWLNNGVTILATSATVPGKTIQLQDIQIVNGLQTTETIYRHFQTGAITSKDRALLVKIVVSSDVQARDRIIRATNNQSPVESAALHATDKIQRDIEEILERYEWYYERRKNYYRNIGKPPLRFVTPLYLANAVVAIIFKNPAKAVKLKSRFMRVQSSYDAVFSPLLPIEIWPVLASVYKQVDAGLAKNLYREEAGERFLRNWRPLISLLAIAVRLKTFAFSTAQLLGLGNSPLSDEEIADAWHMIEQVARTYRGTIKVNQFFVRECCETVAVRLGLLGKEDVGRRTIPSQPAQYESVSPEFESMVQDLLPAQPWRAGIHIEIASKLDCKPAKVTAAIQQLIAVGRRNPQKNGVVYTPDGIVLAVDSERVPFTVDEMNAAGHRLSHEDE